MRLGILGKQNSQGRQETLSAIHLSNIRQKPPIKKVFIWFEQKFPIDFNRFQ